jgi:hypothetical protein
MAADPNWARWAFASVATAMKQLAVAAPIPALVEGLDERTTAYMQSPERVEIRISGPFTRRLSMEKQCDYHELAVDINLLFTSRYEINANQYDILKTVGQFHTALDSPIAMLRLGDQPGDDGSLVGCLLPRTGRNDAVRVFHFGQTDQTDRQKQVMIDARYVAYIP